MDTTTQDDGDVEGYRARVYDEIVNEEIEESPVFEQREDVEAWADGRVDSGIHISIEEVGE